MSKQYDNNHFLPKSFLKLFADSNSEHKKIWCLEKKHWTIGAYGLSQVGHKYRIYYIDAEQEYSKNSNLIKMIDAEAQKSFGKPFVQLNAREKSSINAVLEKRVFGSFDNILPTTLNEILSELDSAYGECSDKQFVDVNKISGFLAPLIVRNPSVCQNAYSEIKKQNDPEAKRIISIDGERRFPIGFVVNIARDIHKNFQSCNWVIVKAGGNARFVLPDAFSASICPSLLLANFDLLIPGYQGTISFMPLSPDYLLIADNTRPAENPTVSLSIADDKLVQERNALFVQRAHCYVYGCNEGDLKNGTMLPADYLDYFAKK